MIGALKKTVTLTLNIDSLFYISRPFFFIFVVVVVVVAIVIVVVVVVVVLVVVVVFVVVQLSVYAALL